MKVRADKAGPINWSGVAHRAVELDLNYLENRRERITMEDVIERLRLSKQTKAEVIEDEGRKLGIEWAKHHAEYDELRRMAQLAAFGPENHGGAPEVYAEVTGREAEIDYEMAGFYLVEEAPIMEIATDEFVAGFVEGARQVWDEVGNKL
jgi:hypothetical protein